jgi:branched-chain amino acid transport system permease protein
LQISLPIGLGLRATPDQLLSLAVAAIVVVAVYLLLSRTAIGRAMRAVSENAALSSLAGVRVRRVIRVVWVLGASLAAVAGVITGLLIQIRPEMGLDLLLPLFAAAILGGIGSVPGAMLAGLIIGLCEAIAVDVVGAQWRAAVSFVILVLVLLVRPQGLFGRAE